MGLPDGTVLDRWDPFDRPLNELFEPLRLRTLIRILVVVDGRLDLSEKGGIGFGVGRVIRLLRESTAGCNRFEVDTARRETKAEFEEIVDYYGTVGDPTYWGFRFDQIATGPLTRPEPLINKYDEIWCFGWNPGNLPGEPDTRIIEPAALPLTDDELRALTEWMNTRQGGLLAMGDHDFIGASMCHLIPRIRSMRRWTNTQGVPPRGGDASQPDGHLRHDTNQPFTSEQIAGTAVIPFTVEEDSKPQPIEVVPMFKSLPPPIPLFSRPHPILCHPKLGVINILPDHPHEGWPFDNDEIDLTAPLNIVGMAGDEYPTVSGIQPRPTVIAYGKTVPDPPFIHEKGACDAKRYPMISVYDGRRAGVGRVVTDATWHHWFDLNIAGFEEAGGKEWALISRYYLNVALWLAPVSPIRVCLAIDVVASHFFYPGIEEYSRQTSSFALGHTLRSMLLGKWGPCWLTSWVFELVREADAEFSAWFEKHLSWNDGRRTGHSPPCFSCPRVEIIEQLILGGMVRASYDVLDSLRDKSGTKSSARAPIDPEAVDAVISRGVAIGINECYKMLEISSKEVSSLLSKK